MNIMLKLYTIRNKVPSWITVQKPYIFAEINKRSTNL